MWSWPSDNQRGFAKFGISSPPKDEDAVSFQSAMQNIQDDISCTSANGRELRELFDRSGDTAKMIVYLYGRGFMAEQVVKLVQTKASSDILLRIVGTGVGAGGDKDLTNLRFVQEQYAKQVVALETYFDQEGSFGFMNDMAKATFYFRVQKSNNCFLIAPCIMTAYLSQKAGRVATSFPVDVSKFVRDTFSNSELLDYVERDAGGDPLKVMKTIHDNVSGSTCSCVTSYSGDQVCNDGNFDLRDKMRQFGPGLVADFQVSEQFDEGAESNGNIGIVRFDGNDFKNTSAAFIHLASVKDDAIQARVDGIISDLNGGRVPPAAPTKKLNSPRNVCAGKQERVHPGITGKKKSMVLLGGRTVGNKTYLLLQNWSLSMPLVEVSQEYFECCRGTLAFVQDSPWE